MTFLMKQFRKNVNAGANCDFRRRFQTTGELCDYSVKPVLYVEFQSRRKKFKQ
jgi:hypothetical protein